MLTFKLTALLALSSSARAQTLVALNICLFVLEFYGSVNNEVMSSRSVNCGTVPGQA